MPCARVRFVTHWASFVAAALADAHFRRQRRHGTELDPRLRKKLWLRNAPLDPDGRSTKKFESQWKLTTRLSSVLK